MVLDSEDKVQLLSLHIDAEDSLNLTPIFPCYVYYACVQYFIGRKVGW